MLLNKKADAARIRKSPENTSAFYFVIWLPFHNSASPCKPCAESCQDNGISLFQQAFLIDLIHQDRDRGAGSISAVIHIGRKFLNRHFQLVGYGLVDPHICLMEQGRDQYPLLSDPLYPAYAGQFWEQSLPQSGKLPVRPYKENPLAFLPEQGIVVFPVFYDQRAAFAAVAAQRAGD